MQYDKLMVTKEIIKQVPKVELHDHLDGGLRIQTILELAKTQGITLPSEDPEALHQWFVRGGGKQKSLSLYLESFALTTKIMQNSAALERVAFEAVEDLASEHVCYAEIRFAPILHIEGGDYPWKRLYKLSLTACREGHVKQECPLV